MNVEEVYLTFVADDLTPANLRRYDGRKIPIGNPTIWPAAGTVGMWAGLPGEMAYDDDGPLWLLREPPPPRKDPPPAWAAALDRKLDEVLAAVASLKRAAE